MGAHYPLGPSSYVDGVLGHDEARGAYVGGEYRRTVSDSDRAHLTASYSGAAGFSGDYRGDHRGEGWETHETVRARGADVSGTFDGRAEARLLNVDVRGGVRVDSRGDWEVSGSGVTTGNGASLVGSAFGTVHNGEAFDPDFDGGEVRGHYALNASSSVDAAIGHDPTRGNFVEGEYRRTASDSDRAHARASYSDTEGFSGDYRGDHRGEGWETHETLRARGTHVSGTLEGHAASPLEDLDVRGRARFDNRGDWEISGSGGATGNGVSVRGSAFGTVHNGEAFDPDFDGGEAGARYTFNASSYVDAVLGHDDSRGTFVGGEYRRTGSASDHAHARASYNDAEGFVGDYRGAHRGEGWETNESLRIRGENVSGAFEGRTDTPLEDVEVRGRARFDNEGDWEVAGNAVDSGSGATFRVNASGTLGHREGLDSDFESGEVGARYPLNPSSALDGAVGHHRTRGTFISGEYRRTGDPGATGTVRGEYSTEGGMRGEYRGDHRVNDSLRVHEEVTVSGDGTGRLAGGADYQDADGVTHRGSGEITRSRDGGVDGEVSYGTTDSNGVSPRATIRRQGGAWGGELNVARNRPGGSESAAIGLSEDSGWSGRVDASRRGELLGANWSTRLNLEAGEEHLMLGGEGGLSVRNIAGSALGVEGSVRGGLETTSRKRVVPGDDWRGDLRREVLAASDEASFVRYAGVGYVTVSGGAQVPLGPVRIEVGARAGRRLEVEHVRLTSELREGERPSPEELFIALDAEVTRKLGPGESVVFIGEMTHGGNASVGVGHSVNIGGALGASVEAGLKATVAVTGRTRIEVVRERGERVRLIVTATDKERLGGGVGVKISFAPDAGRIPGGAENATPDVVGAFGDVARGVADSALQRFLSGGASVERERLSGDRRLADARLDLGEPEVQEAFNRALKGDWSQIEELYRAEHPGVLIERSVFTELEVDGVPMAAYLFGLSTSADFRETLKVSDVILPNGTYEVVSRHDVTAHSSSGWLGDTALSVEDFTRIVTPEVGQELRGVKSIEHWFKWESTNTEEYTSKREVIEQLGSAFLVADLDETAALNQYRERLEAVPSDRRFWVGPRNELQKTSVSTRVMISDTGLDKLAGLDEAAVWEVFGRVWGTIFGTEDEPEWLTEDGRSFLVWMNDITGFYGPPEGLPYEFVLARYCVELLVAASRVTSEEERNDRVRQAMAMHRGPAALGTVMELVGREHVELMVKVESSAGEEEGDYDLTFTHRGAEFDVERRVFGAVL